MVKFLRQILNETPWVNPDIESEKMDSGAFSDEKGQHISTMKSGHRVIKLQHPNDKTYARYQVRDHKTGDVHMEVQGNHTGNRFDVASLNAGHNNTVKAHELYHHLITQHGIHIHSDYEQSEGGMKVWKALHKMPGIHMQSWNGSSEKYSELKPSFQRKYDMDSSTRLAAKKK